MFPRYRIVYLLSAVLLSTGVGRAEEDTQVSVEVKFAELSEDVFQGLQRQGVFGTQHKKTHGQKNVTFLNDAQLLRFMDAIQGDVRTNVMQAPKMTIFNGQKARINFSDEQHFVTGLEIVCCDDRIEYRPKSETVPLGVQIGLHAIISADQRFVRVHFQAKLSNLVSDETHRFPITTPAPGHEKGPDGKLQTVTHYIERPQVIKLGVNRTLVIPDGNTAVLTGWMKPCEVTKNVGPLFLSRIPWLGQLFQKVERETHHVLVMVTPRILINPEEEKRTKTTAKEETKTHTDGKEDYRTPIIPAVLESDVKQSEEPPDEARILRAMPPIENPFPGLMDVSRDNIEIVTERIVDKIDPPRFFPLIGPAQLHHCHWKCTVYYIQTIESGYPFPFRCARPRIQNIYIEKDHLHLYEGDSKTIQ